MEQVKIERINALAAKAKSAQGLTPAEQAERAALREEYVQECRANLVAQLENTRIQYPDGSQKKLRAKPSGDNRDKPDGAGPRG